MASRTVVEILNSSNQRVAEIRNLYPLNDAGMILRYSEELSDYGECTFRVATSDLALTQFGDILVPHSNRVRIRRGGKVVWYGAIVDNTERNKNYIEVRAYTPMWYLGKILIRRDTKVNPGDGKNHLRVFDSGTMKTAVTNIMNQAIADSGSGMLSEVTLGTIENPNFPSIYGISGAWTFSSTFALQFDYHSALYVIKAFGMYSEYDFEIDDSLVFRFKKQIGNQLFKTSLEYGQYGNVVDYNVPRLGARMVNHLVGIAAVDTGEILHASQTDDQSIATYGKLQESTGFSDVKNEGALKHRLKEQLRFTATPDSAPINMVLNENGLPFGQYGVGDVIKVKIKDHNIDYDDWRRIVGVTVSLHNTGREIAVVQTNKPTPGMLE